MQKVLFVCVGNSARSQMAEALFNHLAKGRAQAVSAGTAPASEVAPEAVAVMAEIGLDISAAQPKMLTEEMVQEASRVISMGCGVEKSCPVFLGARIDEDWELEDPYGQSVDTMRRIRDEIRRRVTRLLEQLAN